MPTVPTLGPAPTAQPTGLAAPPADRLLYRSLGSGGQELEDLGHAMQSTGSDFAKIATDQLATQNEAATKNADSDFVAGLEKVLHDPDSGYLNSQGGDAVNGRDGAIDAVKKLQQGISDGITNPRQQQMFSDIANQRTQAALQAIDAHASQQGNKYAIESGMTRAATNGDAAARAYNPVGGADNTLYNQYIDTQKQELGEVADRMGLKDNPDGSDGVRAQFIKENLAKTYTSIVDHLTSNNQLQGAKDFFNSVQDQLPIAVRDKINNTLTAGQDKTDALNVALDVKSQTTDIAAQEKILDQRFKAGDITADVHDMALQKLRADTAQRRSEEAEADKSMIGQIWGLKQKNPNLALTDLTPSQIAYIKNRGLGTHVDAILNSSPAIDDAKLYNDQMRMASEDPSAFVKQDLSTLSGQLTPAHWDHLVGVQSSINRGDVKAMDQAKLMHNTVTDIKAGMLSAGINLTPKPGTPQAKALDAFESSLRDSLVAAQTAKGNAPLSRDEARQIGLGLLKDQTLTGTGWFIDTHKPVWQMTPQERAAPWTIPDADRAQITQALRNRKQPVTEDAIQRLYKYTQGLR